MNSSRGAFCDHIDRHALSLPHAGGQRHSCRFTRAQLPLLTARLRATRLSKPQNAARICSNGAGHTACSFELRGEHASIDDGHALPVLRAAVRDASFERERRDRRARQREVSREPRRPLREGMDGRRDARACRPAARAAGTRRERQLGPASWDAALNRVADGLQQDPDAIRERCGRRVRQRRADQREGVSRRQVRARRPGHGQHRLQRAVLHVVGGRRRRCARSGSIAACPFRSTTSPKRGRSCSSAQIPPKRCLR